MLAEADKVTKDRVDYTYTIYDSKLSSIIYGILKLGTENTSGRIQDLGMARVTGSGRNQVQTYTT